MIRVLQEHEGVQTEVRFKRRARRPRRWETLQPGIRGPVESAASFFSISSTIASGVASIATVIASFGILESGELAVEQACRHVVAAAAGGARGSGPDRP